MRTHTKRGRIMTVSQIFAISGALSLSMIITSTQSVNGAEKEEIQQNHNKRHQEDNPRERIKKKLKNEKLTSFIMNAMPSQKVPPSMATPPPSSTGEYSSLEMNGSAYNPLDQIQRDLNYWQEAQREHEKNERNKPKPPPADTTFHPFFKQKDSLEKISHPSILSLAKTLAKDKDHINSIFNRLEIYYPIVKGLLSQNHVPLEFALLPAVLSGYEPCNSVEESPHRRGFWGMSDKDAQAANLIVNDFIDERCDFIDEGSKKALQNFNRFSKNWTAAILSTQLPQDELVNFSQQPLQAFINNLELKKKTHNIIGLLYAFIELASYPKKYGLEQISWKKTFRYDQTDVPTEIAFGKAFTFSAVGRHLLKIYNPHILKDVYPSSSEDKATTLNIPKGLIDLINWESAYEDMLLNEAPEDVQLVNDSLQPPPLQKQPPLPQQKSPRKDLVYEIKPGDTLLKLSRHFNISLRSILRSNKIKNPSLIFPGQRIHLHNAEISHPYAQKPIHKPEPSIPRKPQIKIPSQKHRIMDGESLLGISLKYNVSIGAIYRLNPGIGQTLSVGDIIYIPLSTPKIKYNPSGSYGSSSR